MRQILVILNAMMSDLLANNVVLKEQLNITR